MSTSHTTSAQRLVLWIRCGGRCERCGRKIPRKGWDAHHRIKQSLGGLEAMSNLTVVDRLCHNAVHRGEGPTGWLLKSWDDPLEQPILMFDGMRTLDDAGGTTPVP